MADIHLKRSGSWSPIANCYIKMSGSWTQVKKVYVKISGTWQQVWANFVVSLSGTSGSPHNVDHSAIDPLNSVAGIRILRNGGLQKYTIAQTWATIGNTWGIPIQFDIGDNYWVRATKISGDTPNNENDGFGSWLNITATKGWSHIQTVIGSRGPTVIKIEIATDSGGSNIVATGYYEFTAAVTGTS
jgi:hypothetical protein